MSHDNSRTAEQVTVFGGSGFLGSHVADALSNAGYRVRLFDLYPSPYRRPDQTMMVGDLGDFEQVQSAVAGSTIVYNFAAIADIDEANNKPLATAQVNIIGNLHVLEACRLAGVRRFVFASSVYVYSESGSFYRVSKQASEGFVETYQERYGLNYSILRYGSLYGCRSDGRNGIYRMLEEAVRNGSITYQGSGEALREYIHVTDAARMSVQILADEFANRHMILTGQERLKIKDVMKMVAEILPWQVELEFTEGSRLHHYEVTPYAFRLKAGHKMVLNEHVDLGQGLIECLADIYNEAHCGADTNWSASYLSDNRA
jgi:UDP-glucose 4-epimerase